MNGTMCEPKNSFIEYLMSDYFENLKENPRKR